MPPITIVPRKSALGNEEVIQMSFQLSQQLQLEKGREIRISIGKKMMILKIETIDMAVNEILFPENLYFEFCLPIQQYKFHAKYIKDHHMLYLGPIIALVTDFNGKGNEEPIFRSIHSFCEELNEGITENGGFFYVFSYPDFPLQGYYFEGGKWHAAELPFPDVIYNRIHSRRLEYAQDYKLFRDKLNQLNIPFFNDRFLSKWEVHEHLIHENHLHSQIPETKIFTKVNLRELTQHYKTVFIKPVNGSQGRNIFKLTRNDDLFLLESSLKIKSENIKDISTIEDIYQFIKPQLNNRIYIIQQGIPLLTYESRSMDFRVLCHKNQYNLWKVTSVVARISAEDEFVSNIARGGEVMSPLYALRELLNIQDAKSILTEMKSLAREIASSISLHSTGITGELGIDIGIDQDGKPWLIEVNSKPSKNFEDGHMKLRPSAKAIIQFSTMLAFKTITEKEGNH